MKTSSIWLATTRSVLLVILGPTKMSCCDKVSHSLSESQVESHISDIRGNVEEAVDGVKKLASLRRYNATHSVLGTRWHRS